MKPKGLLFMALVFFCLIRIHGQQNKTEEIFSAIMQKDLTKTSNILQQNPSEVNKRNENGQTPLAIAVASKDYKIVELLLKNKALVNVGDNQLRAPIHLATFNRDTTMINLLLEYGGIIDTRAIGGATPLIHSSLNNDFDLSKFLLSKGADIHIQCNALTNPLYFAVINNNTEYLNYLVEKGSEINTPDYLGRTPLCIAVRDGNLKFAEILIQHEALKYQNNDYNRKTLLHLAAIEGHIDLVKLLLKNNFEINAIDKSGFTPYDYAIKYGHNAIAEFLVSQGATKKALFTETDFAPKKKQARVIKLQNGSWGIETANSFILLGYSEIGNEPEQMTLKKRTYYGGSYETQEKSICN